MRRSMTWRGLSLLLVGSLAFATIACADADPDNDTQDAAGTTADVAETVDTDPDTAQPIYETRELDTPDGKAWVGLAEVPVEGTTPDRFFVVCMLKDVGNVPPSLGLDTKTKVVVETGGKSLELPKGTSMLTNDGKVIQLPIPVPKSTGDTKTLLGIISAVAHSAGR